MLAAAVSLCAFADEGMWLLPLLEKMNIKTMQQMGCKLTAEEIFSLNKTSLKDAVVIFGNGCTGEVVSDAGLLLTNHHCGYSSIQSLSSVEHDYLANGYWAMTYGEELPVEGLTVTFLDSFRDVTDQVNKATKDCEDEEAFTKAFREISGKLTAPLHAADTFVNASVVSFFGGNSYYLIGYKKFTDIRFVGAPPSSIGKFGADTDNWMWPRHTCDFSVFRIYADKNNNPAGYSADNVPYNPKKKLTVSLKGIEDGDFSMIMGYPGSTNRFMTSYEVREQRDLSNAISIYCRGERQKLMLEDMLADPAVKIQYASKYSGSTNGWKKWIGMNEAFEKLGVEQRRVEEEKAFTEWVGAKSKREKKYGTALSDIEQAVASRAASRTVMRYLTETLADIELCQAASMMSEVNDPGLPAVIDRFYKNYSVSTDRKIAKRMIEIYRDKVDAAFHPAFFNIIDGSFGGDVDAFLDDLYAKSVFASKEKVLAALEQSDAAKILQEDAAAKMFDEILNIYYGAAAASKVANKQFNKGHKAYIAGQLEMKKGQAMYPDANFTMRLTYGTVKSYAPKDGVLYNYYTTLTGVMEKEDPDNWEFVVPEKLKELYAARDFGEYARSDGQMPACFIMTGDITGGNSGSPVLDGSGNLIGLAFDGNWEAMSGDILFEPDLQRCICVDIRYVLFIIDKFGGDVRLIEEMNIVR